MQLSFRQGIVRYDNAQDPDLLTWNGSNINLNIVDSPLTATFAHGPVNYVIDETQNVVKAWRNLPAATKVWLYWDINPSTAKLTYGYTAVEPIATSSEPSNPVEGLHWFDTVSTRMRVYTSGAWETRIRVFAAQVLSDNSIVVYPVGTQVGISGQRYNAGYILLGSNNRPLRLSNGAFSTTDTVLTAYKSGSQNTHFAESAIFASAQGAIPAYYCVSLLSDARMKQATSNDTTAFVGGITNETLGNGDVGQVVTHGVVRNESWTWETINVPLFCGAAGEITTTPPSTGFLQQIGWVLDTNAIFLNITPPVLL